jgi:hypothetical protein
MRMRTQSSPKLAREGLSNIKVAAMNMACRQLPASTGGSMLTRLEGAYLNILRVVILVAATLALVVAAFALVGSAPMLLKQLGVGTEEKVEGGNLAQFIDEQRAVKSTQTSSDASEPPSSQDLAPASALRASAGRIADYVNRHHRLGITREAAEQALTQSMSSVPAEHQAAFIKSLDRLTTELEASTGTPLTPEQINELLNWHQANFVARAAEKASNEQLSGMATLTALATAGGAFFIFLVIVFCFLFVKIERNLRLVRVASDGAVTDLP